MDFISLETVKNGLVELIQKWRLENWSVEEIRARVMTVTAHDLDRDHRIDQFTKESIFAEISRFLELQLVANGLGAKMRFQHDIYLGGHERILAKLISELQDLGYSTMEIRRACLDLASEKVEASVSNPFTQESVFAELERFIEKRLSQFTRRFVVRPDS